MDVCDFSLELSAIQLHLKVVPTVRRRRSEADTTAGLCFFFLQFWFLRQAERVSGGGGSSVGGEGDSACHKHQLLDCDWRRQDLGEVRLSSLRAQKLSCILAISSRGSRDSSRGGVAASRRARVVEDNLALVPTFVFSSNLHFSTRACRFLRHAFGALCCSLRVSSNVSADEVFW